MQFAQKNNIIHYYNSYVQMLDIEHPDCVYISVTVNDHYRLTMLCIERGIPRLGEKGNASKILDRQKNSFAACKGS